MLALGGILAMMASYPAGFVIIEYQTMILAVINCLFDGSCVVFFVLYTIQTAFGTSRQQLFIGLATLSGVVYALLISLWYVNETEILARSNLREDSLEANERLISTPCDNAPNANYKATNVHDPLKHMATLKQLQSELKALQLMDVSVRKQLMSCEFAVIMLYTVIQMLRATIYIGTTNKLLETYGDEAHGYIYTKIFGLVLPLGFIFVPAVDCIVERKGLEISLLAPIGLGIMCCRWFRICLYSALRSSSSQASAHFSTPLCQYL